MGTITGRRSAQQGNTSFTGGLTSPQVFSSTERVVTFESKYGYANSDRPGNFSKQALKKGAIDIYFDPVTRSYTLTDPTVLTPGYGGDLQDSEEDKRTWVDGRTIIYQQNGTVPGSGLRVRASTVVFGMPTGDAAVPRSGLGAYAVAFGGRAVDHDYKNLMKITGSGTIKADFANGTLTLDGVIGYHEDWVMSGRQPVDVAGTAKGTATLSASTNAFSGAIALNGLGTYKGTWEGAFFGPKAQEIGATFSAAAGSDALVGTIVGASDPSIINPVLTLANLTAKTTFDAVTSYDVYTKATTMRFDPATHAWRFLIPNSPFSEANDPYNVLKTFGDAQIVAANSNASRTWYENGDHSLSGYVFKWGADNPVLALTYSSFSDFNVTSAFLSPMHTFSVFGSNTPAAQMPKTGKASYAGIARGTGYVTGQNYRGDFVGTSRLVADFAAGSARLTLVLKTDQTTQRAVGTFVQDLSIGGTGVQFYGPTAQEFGAAWTLVADPPAGRIQGAGIAIGKRN